MNPEAVLKLWSEQGISWEEIKARITERTDAEIAAAVNMQREAGLLDREHGVKLATQADQYRDSKKIMELAEPYILPHLEKYPEDVRLNSLELQLLTIEGYVRSSNRLFPKHGNN